MAVCPECNAPTDEQAAACPACGCDLAEPAPNYARRAVAVAGGVAGAVALIAFEGNPIAQIVSGSLLVLFWASLATGAWRVFRD